MTCRQYAKKAMKTWASPMVKYGWMLAVAIELGGGLAILLGLFTRPVGLVLAIWCVATALIAHTNFADRNQEIHFLKNMAMMGGFLYVAAFGAGAWSLDAVGAPRSLAAVDPNFAALPRRQLPAAHQSNRYPTSPRQAGCRPPTATSLSVRPATFLSVIYS
jgi:uncharacterized membrane protein YphA (DoxX/SURF4 family)